MLSSNPVLPVALLDDMYAKSIAEINWVSTSTNYPLLFSSFSFPSFSSANFDRSHATLALGLLGMVCMCGTPITQTPHTAARYARHKNTHAGAYGCLGPGPVPPLNQPRAGRTVLRAMGVFNSQIWGSSGNPELPQRFEGITTGVGGGSSAGPGV